MNPTDPNAKPNPNPKPPASTGPDPGDDTPEGIEAKKQQIEVHIQAIADIVGSAGTHDPNKKLPKVTNPYGKQLNSFALGAALTAEGVPGPFTRFGGIAGRLRQNSARGALLSSTKTALAGLSRSVSFTLGQITSATVDDIGTVINVRDNTVDNKATDPKDRVQMERSSELLTQLRTGRSAGSAGKGQSTRTSAGKLTDAHGTIDKLNLENKYLRGDKLTPDDLIKDKTGSAAAAQRSGGRRQSGRPPKK